MKLRNLFCSRLECFKRRPFTVLATKQQRLNLAALAALAANCVCSRGLRVFSALACGGTFFWDVSCSQPQPYTKKVNPKKDLKGKTPKGSHITNGVILIEPPKRPPSTPAARRKRGPRILSRFRLLHAQPWSAGSGFRSSSRRFHSTACASPTNYRARREPLWG